MAHEDGTIEAAELYPVAEACGQSPEQVRSCLRRLVGGEHDPRELARRLWPVDELDRRYREFAARFSGVPEALADMRKRHQRLPDGAFLPGALAMAVAFNDVFQDDPLLPPELLPRPW